MNNRMFSRSYLDEIRKARGERGFTMVEVITAVAIVIVLLAVAFVALWQYRITLAQAEVDGVAREIYVAAQNHLSLAAEQGLISPKADDDVLGKKDTSAVSSNADDAIRFLVYSAQSGGTYGPNGLDNSALRMMLPVASIDETVRKGGNYIVRYQPSTGRILDVFYAKPDGFGKLNFEESDCSTLMGDYAGDSHSQDRRSFKGGIVGYYGGEGEGETLSLTAPTVEIDNGDSLKVMVTEGEGNPSNDDDVATKLIVQGDESKAIMFFDLRPSEQDKEYVLVGNKKVVYLDDVIDLGVVKSMVTGWGSRAGHFGDVVTNRKGDSLGKYSAGGSESDQKDFIPGENLKVYAWTSTTGATGRLSNVAKSVEYTTNSLFASGDPVTDPTTGMPRDPANPEYEVHISSFRHLANLSQDVSGFDHAKLHATNNVPYTSVTAQQDTDLTWSTFRKSVVGMPADAEEPAGSESLQVRVCTLDGKSANEGSFYPVTPGYALTYDGGVYVAGDAAVANPADAAGAAAVEPQAVSQSESQPKLTGSHWISGVRIDDSASDSAKLATAGIFGDLTEGSTIQNLELVDTVINATGASANAGALAGSVGANGKITNVLARQNLSNGNSRVTSAGVAGGLIGTVGNGATITGCAAAIYVTANGDAGGLVGSAGNATILDSYSGGHTKQGKGKFVNPEDANDKELNIISNGGAAGGLAGSAAGTINYCYSTCSVSGNPAGGLVGNPTGVIQNSYAAGKVFGNGESAATGAFAGRGDFGGNGNMRLEGINPGMYGNEVNDIYTKRTNPDMSDLDVYKSFFASEGGPVYGAIPYDEKLASAYRTKVTDESNKEYVLAEYIMPTIMELDSGCGSVVANALGMNSNLGEGETYIPSHLTTHYGDWEMPETLVVNTKQ